MGFIYASTTLMLKIMILKSVSMPMQRCIRHMEMILHKDDLETFIWMIKLEETSKIIQHIKQVIKGPLLEAQRLMTMKNH